MEKEMNLTLLRISYGMVLTLIIIWRDFNDIFSFLFEPNNIKNFSTDNFKRSISLHQLWSAHGGVMGLA